MPYMEIASLIGGAASGFIFKMMAQNASDKAAQFNRMMDAIKASDESANKAILRVPNDKNGNWVRRFLIISLVFSVCIAPLLLTLIDKNTIVQIETPIRSFFGLFQYGGKTEFYQLNGYLISREMQSVVISVFALYFGSSLAKR